MVEIKRSLHNSDRLFLPGGTAQELIDAVCQ
jgi:hypothetical protein